MSSCSFRLRHTVATLLLTAASLSPAAAQLLPRGLPETFFTDIPGGDPELAVALTGETFLAFPRLSGAQGTLLDVRVFDANGFNLAHFDFDPGTSALVQQRARFSIAGRATGDLLIAFSRYDPSVGRNEIAVQQVSSLGLSVGPVEIVQPAQADVLLDDPVLSCNRVGRCVLVWRHAPASGPSSLRGKVFDGLSNPPNNTFTIEPPPGGALDSASIAVADDGRFALTYTELRRVESPPGFLFEYAPIVRLFDALGNVLTTLPLEPASALPVSMTRRAAVFDTAGRLLLTWTHGTSPTGDGQIRGRRLDVFGNTLPNPILSLDDHGYGARAAWDPATERFAISWQTLVRTGEQNLYRVLLRVLSSEGEPLAETMTGTEIERFDPAEGIAAHDLAINAASNVFLSWSSLRRSNGTGLADVQRVLFSEPDPLCALAPPSGRPECVEIGPGGRFLVKAAYRRAEGTSAAATGEAITPNAAFLFFQGQENPEVVAKVLDGRTLNEHFWYFSGAMSNQEYSISVFDRETGRTQVYYNRADLLRSLADTGTFRDGPLTELALADESVPAKLLARGEAVGRDFDLALAEPDSLLATRGTGCSAATATTLCLNQSRFRVEITFRDPATGNLSAARAVQTTTDGGFFTFFNPNNVEVALKILDGTAINGKFWVFYASLSNVRFTVRVFGPDGALVKTYVNPLNTLQSVADTAAF